MGLLITPDYIKQYVTTNEKLLLDVKVDPLGNKFIGFGHLLSPTSKVTHIDEEKAFKWLDKDFCKAFTQAQQLTDNYQLLLPFTDMCFQMREGVLRFWDWKSFKNEAYTAFIFSLVYKTPHINRELTFWLRQTPKRAKKNIMLICEALGQEPPTDLVNFTRRGQKIWQ